MHLFIISLFSLLVFILNIPHTIAIRNIFLYILLISLGYIIFRTREVLKSFFKNTQYKKIFMILGVLTLYILLHSLFISHEPLWSLDEFRGQWITPIIYLLIGLLLAFYATNNKNISKEVLFTILFYAMFIHILYIDLVAFDKWLQTKSLISRYGGLTGSPVLVNYLTNILLAMVISEIIYRLRMNTQVLKISNLLLYLYLVLLLVSTFVEGMRHGVVALVSLGFVGAIIFLYKNQEYSKKIKTVLSLAIFLVMLIPLAYNIKYDNRWNSLIETIDISLDTENNKYWLNRKFDIPKLESGQDVSGSNYERMAWAYKGFQYILEDPFGIGFGRNSFGHANEIRYGKDAQRGYHSHSSLIDFTIGIGIIGLVLWIAFVFTIIKMTIVSFKNRINYSSMFVFFITSGFFARSVVDSNMRDHMFLQFMLMLGIGLVFMFFEDRRIDAKT